MGATKRFAEMLIMQMGASSDTKICCGSVWKCTGSRGSVIPLLRNRSNKAASHGHPSSCDKIFYDHSRSIKTCHSSGSPSRRKTDFCIRYGGASENC
ncbi:polysaccharide biosynthesis protein [Bacillus sp. SL00103]